MAKSLHGPGPASCTCLWSRARDRGSRVENGDKRRHGMRWDGMKLGSLFTKLSSVWAFGNGERCGMPAQWRQEHCRRNGAEPLEFDLD